MKREKGFVSTEIGIGIFVVGMLGLAGFLAAQFLVSDSNSAIMVSQAQDTIKNIRHKYRFQRDFNDLDAANVIKLNAAPRTMIASDTSLMNNFGGQVTFGPTSCSGSNDCFTKSTERLPDNICVDYVNGMVEVSDSIRVGSTEVKSSGEHSITQSTLISACDNPSNSVESTHTRA